MYWLEKENRYVFPSPSRGKNKFVSLTDTWFCLSKKISTTKIDKWRKCDNKKRWIIRDKETREETMDDKEPLVVKSRIDTDRYQIKKYKTISIDKIKNNEINNSRHIYSCEIIKIGPRN